MDVLHPCMSPGKATDCACPAGKAGPRNASQVKQDAARAAKRQKSLLHAPIIDLSDNKSDEEEAIIDLIDSRSPAVVLHRRNRFASAAGSSCHGSQPHPSSQPIIANNCRSDVSSSGNPCHNQTCSLTAQHGGSLSITRTHSSNRKRSAPSSDTVRKTRPSGSLGQPSNLLSGASSHVSPASTSKPFVVCNQHHSRAGDSDSHEVGKLIPGQHISRPAATKPLQAPQRSAPSELAGGHIDLVKVTEEYSGALQAADKRVQHATTDPALAKALAEKAELEQQLKVELSCNCLCSGTS